MNILDGISVQRSQIIDAYTKILGDKYRDIIEKRVNRILFVQFEDSNVIENYCYFLKDCKRKELSIKFLEKIGIDIDNNEKENYFEKLNEDSNNLICKYIGGYKYIDPIHNKMYENYTGILAWKSLDENIDLELIEEEKINFINFLRGQSENAITKETYQSFLKTDEYKQIEEKIEECLKAYDEIVKEYEDYIKKDIEPHEKHKKEESEREKSIRENRVNLLYEQIERILPDGVKDFFNNNYSNIDEKKYALFLGGFLGIKTVLEYFSQKDEDKLKDSTTSDNDKNNIYWSRMCYFKQMGAITDDDIDLKKIKESYENCIKKETVQRFIIPPQIADEIAEKMKKAYEETKREIVFTSQNFIKNAENFEDKEGLYELREDVMNGNCLAECIFGRNKYGFNSIICYSIKNHTEGKLDYIILHEICHAIENNENKCGFDFVKNPEKNPYNPQWRKYGRLNEAITDIFAIEARQYLHEKEIYLVESKELIKKNVNDDNTHSIEKDLLKPFLNKYRDSIIEARVFDNMDNLYNMIGEENFEELNDVVNKVDYLIYSNNLVEKLKNNQNEDSAVVQYHQQLERLNQVYANMEMHRQKQKQGKNLLKSAIDVTKGKVRLGKINDWIASIKKNKEKDYEQHENK